VPRDRTGGISIGDLCNRFLTSKTELITSGELTVRSFRDYNQSTDRIVRVFGKNRRVDDLVGEDFALLRADIAKNRGPISVKNEITRCKVVFNFAFRDALIDKPVVFGAGFDPPKAKVIRKALAKNGPRMFEAAELRAILNKCPTPTLKAMVLLAANSGMGNHDVGMITFDAVNLETGWCDFPREKTGTPRRFRLWPETLEAIKESLATRPTPAPGHEQYLFLTRKRHCWSKDGSAAPLAREFKKVLDDAGITRPGAGYYDLRRTFQTIGEEAGEIATKYIMGHVDGSMSARYRQRISDERLEAVRHERQRSAPGQAACCA
jgi:integrase